jgi:hypothetical protein
MSTIDNTSTAARVCFTLSCLQAGLFQTRARRKAEAAAAQAQAKADFKAMIAANLAAPWQG